MELVPKKKNFFQAFSHPRTLIKIRCPKPNLTSTPIEASIIVMKGHHKEQTATAEQKQIARAQKGTNVRTLIEQQNE